MSTISDSMVGSPTLYGQSAVQEIALGTIYRSGDGRRFRYVKVGGTALVQGKLYQSAAESASNWEALSVAAAAIGATKVTLTSSVTLTADVLAGGYMAISTNIGIGYTYKITGNTAVNGAAGCVITLDDPIQVALDTTTTIDVIPNPASKVELWDYTNHDGAVMGVAIYPVTASYYGWLQTGGPCACLVDAGNLAVGLDVSASDDTDGAVGPLEEEATSVYVGRAITASSSTEYGLVNLNIN